MFIKSIGLDGIPKSNSTNAPEDGEKIATKSKEQNSLDPVSLKENSATCFNEDNSEESFLSFFIQPLKHSMSFFTNQIVEVSSFAKKPFSSGENNSTLDSSSKSISQTDLKEEHLLSNITRKMQKIRTSKCAEEIQEFLHTNIFCPDQEKDVLDIVCYGIGSLMDECEISINQLCVLLLLKEILSINQNGKTFIYDPAFGKRDKEFLSQLGLSVIDHNERGKRHVSRKTIFFTPCVDIFVVSNILWANWGLSLSNVILFGNSITEICKMKKRFKSEFNLNRSPYRDNEIYFERILPYEQEFPMTMTRKFLQMEDLCFHFFPLKSIANVPEELWRMNEEYHTPNKLLKDKLTELSTTGQALHHHT